MAMLKEARASMNKGSDNEMDKDIKELCLEIIKEQKHIENRLDTMNYTITENSKNIEKIMQAIVELNGNILSHVDYSQEKFDFENKRWLDLRRELDLYKIREQEKTNKEYAWKQALFYFILAREISSFIAHFLIRKQTIYYKIIK